MIYKLAALTCDKNFFGRDSIVRAGYAEIGDLFCLTEDKFWWGEDVKHKDKVEVTKLMQKYLKEIIEEIQDKIIDEFEYEEIPMPYCYSNDYETFDFYFNIEYNRINFKAYGDEEFDDGVDEIIHIEYERFELEQII